MRMERPDTAGAGLVFGAGGLEVRKRANVVHRALRSPARSDPESTPETVSGRHWLVMSMR